MLNKRFRVYFEHDEKGENYWHELPTREEAEERADDLLAEGFINIKIEEIRI